MFIRSSYYFHAARFKGDFKKFKGEFKDIRTNENAKRCDIMAVMLMVVNVILVCIDRVVYRPMKGAIPAYGYLYFSHVVMLIFLSLWIILSGLNKRYGSSTYKRFLNRLFFYIIIAWCTFMGINSIRITGGVSAYIICMFCCAAWFFIAPSEAALTYSTSGAIFIGGMLMVISSKQLLYSNLVNLIITMLLVQMTSALNYSSFLKDFINTKRILQNQEEMEVANKKLKEYEQLRTDYFANISHELRTPLNVICSAQQMLDSKLQSNQCDEDVKIGKYLKMIKQNSYRLLRLINNLIDITKIDADSFKVKLINADIIKIVEDITLSVVDFTQQQGITLIFDTEIEEKVIACDPDNIERIMLNLLSNAVKYVDKEGFIFVNVFLEEDTICIAVRDTGVGISEEMQRLIFNRFMQVDRAFQKTREGSGIGLALVKSLVEMHEGNISVKSKLGEGSEFIISLPNRQLPESNSVVSLSQGEEKYTQRISIEFSDIYT